MRSIGHDEKSSRWIGCGGDKDRDKLVIFFFRASFGSFFGYEADTVTLQIGKWENNHLAE